MFNFIVGSVTFAIAVLCFVLIYMIRKKDSGSKKIPWLAVPVLALLGGSCLAATTLGLWLSGFVSGLIGPILVMVACVILLLAIYLDLKDKHCDKTALIGLIFLPVLFQAGTGPLADVGNQFSSGVQGVAENSVGRVIGG